jgi:hypothetical protein
MAKQAAARRKRPDGSSYWMKAPVPESLAEELLVVVETIRSGRFQPADNERIVEVVAQMTETVVRYAFMRPVEAIDLGFAARSVAEVAIRSSIKSTRYGLKMVIPRLNDDQRRQFASFLEAALHEQ